QMAPGGRFSATGVDVKRLMAMAYNVRDYQITGLPSWAESDQFDITAKPEGDAPPQEGRAPTPAEMQTQQQKMRAMLKDLLADRFGLKIHTETKELPVYALVLAKGGPKMQESTVVPPPPDRDGGGRGRGGQVIRMSRGQIDGQGMPMQMLVNQLSTILGRN